GLLQGLHALGAKFIQRLNLLLSPLLLLALNRLGQGVPLVLQRIELHALADELICGHVLPLESIRLLNERFEHPELLKLRSNLLLKLRLCGGDLQLLTLHIEQSSRFRKTLGFLGVVLLLQEALLEFLREGELLALYFDLLAFPISNRTG